MIKFLLPFGTLLFSSIAVTAQSPALPAWNYSVVDQRAGTAGLFVLETGNGPEIFCSSHAGASLWLALRLDPATGDYQIVHVSDPVSTSEPLSFQPVQVTGDATPELVLAHQDGTIAIYDATTRALLSKLRPMNSLWGFIARDIDGDGSPELIGATLAGLFVHDINGREKWRLDGAGGFSMTVGQMDSDPALEIATTRAQVVDTGTRSLQWDPPGDWYPVAAVDVDGDGVDEVLTEGAWSEVIAYDVVAQTLKWSKYTSNGTNDFLLANVDDDPEPELLTSGFPGTRAFDLSATGLSQKWTISSPDGPSLGNAVGQLDGDSELEIVRTTRNPDTWGARLRVAGIPSLQEEWVSAPLRGPFVGMCKGDVTGDGIPDYVFGSGQSGGEKGGRLQVVDANTLFLTGVSEPVAGAGAKAEIRDVSLCDIEGDGRFEIAVTGIADGVEFDPLFAEIYRFEPQQGFIRIWRTPEALTLTGSQRIEVLDVDGNGDLEVVVAGQSTDPTWDLGVFVFDFDSGIEQWRSPGFPEEWSGSGPLTLAVSDVDGDGRVEAVLGWPDAGFEVYDLGLRSVEQSVSVPNLTCLASRAGRPGILVGTNDGYVALFTKNGAGNYANDSGELAFAPSGIQQIIPAFGDSLFTVAQDRIRLHQENGPVIWQTAVVTGPLSQRLAPLRTVDGWELFTNVGFGGSSFPVDAMNTQTVVDLIASGRLREAEASQATVVVTRHQPGPGALPVSLSLSGTATPGADFMIAGATQAPDGSWNLEIPAGAASATVTLTLAYDELAENEETLDLSVVPETGYVAGPDRTARLRISDNEPVVEVYFSRREIREETSVKTGEGTEMVLLRKGDLSRSLKVPFSTGGTATNGKDFTKLGKSVTFKAGEDRAAIKLVAGRDGLAEGEETLVVSLSPAASHGVKEGAGRAELTIGDLASTVQLLQAVPMSKGVKLILSRSGSLDLDHSLMVMERRTHADGGTKTFRRKVTFPKGSSEGILPIIGGKTAARIEWSLVDDGTFFITGPATLGYDWSPGS